MPLGAIHKVRTQHGGGGVSPKCVQMRAGGGGVFNPMSVHAKAVKERLKISPKIEVLASL